MDCLEFHHQLQNGLDQRQDPRTPELRAHVDECEACRRELADALLVLRAVSHWRKSMPSVDLVDRIAFSEQSPWKEIPVVEGLPVAGPQVTVVRPRLGQVTEGHFSRGLLVASAAALCFMFWSASFRNDSTSSDSQSSSRALARARFLKAHGNGRSSEKQVKPSKMEREIETVLASAGGAYSQLAQETAAVAHDFALLVPAGGLFRSVNSSAEDRAAVPLKVDGLLPTNVYPVGDSVENALHLLWQAVPGMEKRS